MPKRSANRPTMMPPIMKPIIVSVYGREAPARCTPKSACTAGSATAKDHRPTQPSVLRVIETTRRTQEYEVSMEDGSGAGGTTQSFGGCKAAHSVRAGIASDKAGFLLCRASAPHAFLEPALPGARHDLSTAAPQCPARLRGGGSPPQLQAGRTRAARHRRRHQPAGASAGGAAGRAAVRAADTAGDPDPRRRRLPDADTQGVWPHRRGDRRAEARGNHEPATYWGAWWHRHRCSADAASAVPPGSTAGRC